MPAVRTLLGLSHRHILSLGGSTTADPMTDIKSGVSEEEQTLDGLQTSSRGFVIHAEVRSVTHETVNDLEDGPGCQHDQDKLSQRPKSFSPSAVSANFRIDNDDREHVIIKTVISTMIEPRRLSSVTANLYDVRVRGQKKEKKRGRKTELLRRPPDLQTEAGWASHRHGSTIQLSAHHVGQGDHEKTGSSQQRTSAIQSMSNTNEERLHKEVTICAEAVDSDVLTRRYAPSLSTGLRTDSGAYTQLRQSTKDATSTCPELRELVYNIGPLDQVERVARLESFGQLGSPEIPFDGTPSLPLSVSVTRKFHPLRITAVQSPSEIIQQIYSYLAPLDFNAARHTCRKWFISSLECSVLDKMLRRGGWTRSMQAELRTKFAITSQLKYNRDWLVSKRISRECALLPSWTGDGVPGSHSEHGVTALLNTSFAQTSVVDFTELSLTNNPSLESFVFVVSGCGRYVMVSCDCTIHIYGLNRRRHMRRPIGHEGCDSLHPMAKVICPRRVMTTSMDTSSGRFAIAVLTEGRVGLVYTLDGALENPESEDTLPDACASGGGESCTIYTSQAEDDTSSQGEGARGSRSEDTWEDSLLGSLAIDSPRRFGLLTGKTTSSFQGTGVSPILPTVYAPLCTADDPPRSVAICPQRRCVAFGCSTGIELHWVDALTGQDLSRWFPLTAPSDYLYFLPPRTGVDSIKKLRLISSAGKPNAQFPPSRRGFVHEPLPIHEVEDMHRRGNSGPFWGILPNRHAGHWLTLGANSDEAGTNNMYGSYDHYRAIPLSDGYHILFADPLSECLCLGSDAPLGGPTKLLRKIWFRGPESVGGPIAYAAAHDLRWGVRVVAVYRTGNHSDQQSIWLFSVPLDVFAHSLIDHTSNRASLFGAVETEVRNTEWIDWWHGEGQQRWHHPSPGLHRTGAARTGVWPIQVRGQKIGECEGLMDLAIDGGPDMVIWIFEHSGMMKTWRLDDGHVGSLKRRSAARSGGIRECDEEGDVEMKVDLCISASSDTCRQSSRTQSRFDGADAGSSSRDGTRRHKMSSKRFTQFDGDGDVLMDYLVVLPEYPSHEPARWILDMLPGEELLHRNGRLLGRSRVSQMRANGQDLIEELTGIARIEIEVR